MIVPRHTGHGLSDSVATDSRTLPEGTFKDCFRRCRDWSATGESGGRSPRSWVDERCDPSRYVAVELDPVCRGILLFTAPSRI